MFYLVHAPGWMRRLHPGCLWEVSSPGQAVFLTFDDGPDPDATPFVLDQLAMHGMQATFFCIGQRVEAHPALYDRILREGHRTGNHTHRHLNGWRTGVDEYLEDVSEASTLIESRLFRPPYGRLRPAQLSRLKKQPYHLLPVMWSVLSGDFDPGIAPERCIHNVLHYAKPGSIITFHDSRKAFPVLKEALPAVLKAFAGEGWEGRVIS